MWPLLVGPLAAKRHLLLGDPLTAADAVRLGVAVESCGAEQVSERGRAWAKRLAAKPPLAVRLAKEAVLRAFDAPLAEALAAERQAFALLASSHDRNEGIAAFLGKRPPQFTGR